MNDFQTGTIRYFSSSENILKSFRKAQRYLENLFEYPLALSDRSELRKEVNLSIEEAKKVDHPADYQIPEQLAVARFLISNYPSLDSSLVAQALVSLHRISRLNKEIKFLRDGIYN